MWKCFHCGEEFHDTESAACHFGRHEGRQPACLIDIEEVREMERELDSYRAEDSELERQIHGLRADHQRELRRTEELGYSRALRDVKYADAQLERLPKTGDGQPIFLGDTLFCENFDRSWFGESDVIEVKITSIHAGLVFDSYRGTVTVSGEDVELGNLEFYADREAVPVTGRQHC